MSKNTTKAYIRDIATRINNPGIYGGVSLMVGAGFSKNAESVGSRKAPPDWKELAESMYEELYLMPVEADKIKEWDKQKTVKTSGKNMLHLAEEYIAFFDRNKMDALIEYNIADDKFKPGELHRRLLQLNWKDIFTTNYDTLLERTRDDIFPKKDYKVVLSQDNLPGSRGEKARIIKLNGSISGVRPYIISEEDFRCYPIKFAAFVNTVQQALIETTLCMVGFSGDDPNFLNWHGWLHDNLGENCPQIYLIGLFGKMNESERAIFRKRKIALVDLETLLDGNEKDKYAAAYGKFFELIESELKEVDFSEQAPYFRQDICDWKEEEEDEYVARILKFSNNILSQKGDIVLLPQLERDTYQGYFKDKFNILIGKCKHINKILIQTISNLIAVQRMCLIPLYDDQADSLMEICDTLEKNGIDVSADWKMQMYLYLLEMYRIDSNEEKYQEIVSVCDKSLNELSDNNKNMYWIELAKHAAGLFDAEEVGKQLEKIRKADIKISIVKAGLYAQIGKKDNAEKILEECLNSLSKLRLDVSLNASYKSYLNLCYTAIKRYNRDEGYSDYEYRNDKYRIRNIITEIENELRNEVLKAAAKDDIKENVFEVNFSRLETITIGVNRLQKLSFEFILMLDMLCIPLFGDEKILLPTAMRNIIETSSNPYWKISFMMRANNKDVVERTFSRRDIAKLDIDVINELYDKIWGCVQGMDCRNHEYQNSFFSFINALNIISRMVVFLDDKKIIEVIKYISRIRFKGTDYRNICSFISRMSTRFHGKMGEKLLEEIFLVADSRLCLASYFISFDMEIQDSDRYYSHAISLARESVDYISDNGIALLLCLWRNCKNIKYKAQIENVLWNGKKDVFPSTKGFNNIIWEELPHPDGIDFSELYRKFVYDGLVNHISDQDLFSYVNLFYLTSPMGDGTYSLIKIDAGFLKDILKAVEIELKKENNDSEIDFWEGNTTAFKFRRINELLLIICAIGSETADKTDIISLMNDILDILIQKKMNCFALDAVKRAITGKYVQALNLLKTAVWSGDERMVSEAFIGYRAILYVAKKKNDDISLIKNAIIEVIEAIQYSDIEFVKSVWNLLCQLIVRTFSEDTGDIQIKLAKIFENCINSYYYKGKQGDKYYFEALYNCNKALRSYYDKIKANNEKMNIDPSLYKVIEFVKTLNMPELSSIWVSRYDEE